MIKTSEEIELDKKKRRAFMARQWRLNNPEKEKEHKRRCYLKNKEKRKEHGKEYYLLNREEKILKQREYYNNNKEAVKKYQRDIRVSKPEKALFIHARNRASKKGVLFTISESDITVPKICPLLEIPIYVGEDKLCDNSPTLDRINNNLGYVKGNIQVISYKANRIKNNASFEELEMIYINWKKQGDNK